MIEVGEYIRTTDGEIHKIKSIEGNFIEFENGYGISVREKDYILKHSKDILDLIKKDDYINGTRVEKITKNYITIGNATFGRKGLKGIKSIVTKEAYKNIEYRL